MLLMVSGAPPQLEKTRLSSSHITMSCGLLNVREIDVRAPAEVLAFPFTVPVSGWLAALSLHVALPIFAPVVVGVNVTVRVQLPLTARVEGLRGQLLVWLKSPVLAPVSEMLLMVNGAL